MYQIKKGTSKRDARNKKMLRKTTDEMIHEMQKLNLLNDTERILDSYTFTDPTINGQFITVITVDVHVYFKITYFYNYASHEYRFITVNGCM